LFAFICVWFKGHLERASSLLPWVVVGDSAVGIKEVELVLRQLGATVLPRFNTMCNFSLREGGRGGRGGDGGGSKEEGGSSTASSSSGGGVSTGGDGGGGGGQQQQLSIDELRSRSRAAAGGDTIQARTQNT
jgi:hypothetical protein